MPSFDGRLNETQEKALAAYLRSLESNMAGNTQMNENERGIFKLHGITGMLIV